MSVIRRLAAILAADVAGYSRLIGADEQGTLNRLRALRTEVIDPKIAAHHGRLVKTTGDGLLVEFASVVDALRCAIEIQQEIAGRNTDTVAAERIEYRIGINMGDIVVEADGDIFGDGVNIAARLEGLAEPGEICVSARVQEDAAGKLDLVFRDLGEQQLKNIARQVRAYAIDAVPIPPPRSTATSVPRLSIVVLPFANLSNDPEQQYFADGITEDLTTDLSRIDGMLVISRNTAFTYQAKRIDTRQIGRELSVRYVLEGSVRRSGNQVRINAQLIDAETDRHLWAERFDGDISDLFALQDEVTGRIANALDVELVTREAARPTDHPDVLDYILRGRAVRAKGQTRENCTEAISLFERALALDPISAQARIMLILALTSRVLDNMTDSPVADLERAEELCRQAVAALPHSPLAHHGKGQLLRAQGRQEEAITEYETAIALDRNAAASMVYLAWCKFVTGSEEDTIPLCEKAIRLSPRDSLIGAWYVQIGRMLLHQSRIEEAILWLERARSANPSLWYVHTHLAAAYALKGETDRASAELAEVRRLDVYGRFSSISRLNAVPETYYPSAKVRAMREATFLAGLRKAGMPEE
jgi:TolB-like protein/class 3 adenylate cyclase